MKVKCKALCAILMIGYCTVKELTFTFFAHICTKKLIDLGLDISPGYICSTLWKCNFYTTLFLLADSEVSNPSDNNCLCNWILSISYLDRRMTQ